MARCGNAACSKGRVMGGMVNDVGSRDDAAGARVKEEVGWYGMEMRRVRRGAGAACRARAVWARDGRDGQ